MTEQRRIALQLRRQLLTALLGGDRRGVLHALQASANAPLSRLETFSEVMAPAMHEIGRLWERNELSIAEEHLASEIMSASLQEIRAAPLDDDLSPTAVVSCAPGEAHVLAAQLVRELLSERGWRVWFLGASSPAQDIVEFVGDRRPRLLVLAITLDRHVPGARDITRQLARGPHRPYVLIGGAAVRPPHDEARLGADAIGTSLEELVSVASELEARCGWSSTATTPDHRSGDGP